MKDSLYGTGTVATTWTPAVDATLSPHSHARRAQQQRLALTQLYLTPRPSSPSLPHPWAAPSHSSPVGTGGAGPHR